MPKRSDSKYTLDDVRSIVESRDFIVVNLDAYSNVQSRVIFRDTENYYYNLPFKQFLNSIARMHKKPYKFSPANSFSIANAKNWLSANKKDFDIVSTEYTDAHEKLLFKCSVCGYIFDMLWGCVTRGEGCPYCFGNRVSTKNSLVVNYPELVGEWDFEKNQDIDINNISKGSNRVVWWRCKTCGNSYKAGVGNRAGKNSKCAVCMNLTLTDRNRLSILYPEISKEWCYSKNIGNPSDYSYGSGKNVFWHCPICDNDYCKTVDSRTYFHQGCPYCAMSGGAQRVYNYLKNNNYIFKSEYWFDDLRSDLHKPLQYDFSILNDNGDILGLIEFDGKQHEAYIYKFHKSPEKFIRDTLHDKMKTDYAASRGIPFLRIKAKSKNIESLLKVFLEHTHCLGCGATGRSRSLDPEFTKEKRATIVR
jgi:hypothetical protein